MGCQGERSTLPNFKRETHSARILLGLTFGMNRLHLRLLVVLVRESPEAKGLGPPQGSRG